MTCEEENERLREQIKLYRFDYLTGLKQKRDFEYDVRKKFSETDFYLAMWDINGLHEENRIHGYSNGDALIRRVSNDLQMLGGRIYRISGDEFVGIFCEAPITITIDRTTNAIVNTEHYKDVDEAFDELDKLIIEEKKRLKRRREDI